MEILDLGCGKNKYPGSFGVDFIKLPTVDFVWDLNNKLPKKFYNKYDIVYTKCVIDHLGNPLNFLEGCKKYLKNKGKLILIADNGDYWRYHFHLGNYHADIWECDALDYPETHHKMFFQMKHLIKILHIVGFKIIKTDYYSDYSNLSFFKKIVKGHFDFILPKHLGSSMIVIEAVKS